MTAGVSTEFKTTKDEVTPALKKQREEYERGKKAAEGLAAANRRNEQAALSAVNKSLSGQERLQAVIRGTESLKKRGQLTDKESARAQQFIKEQADGTAQKRREAERAAKGEQKAVEAIAARQNKVVIGTRRALAARKQGLITARQLKAELRNIHNIQDKTATATRSWRSQVAQVALGYVGINSIIQAGNQLIQKRIQLEEKAGQNQVTLAQAENQLFFASIDFTPEEGQELNRRITSLDAKLPLLNRAGVTQVYASSLQATAGPPIERLDRIDPIIERLGQLFVREDPQVVGEFAGRILDFAKVTDRFVDENGKKRVSDDQLLGTFANVVSQSRVNFEKAGSLIPAISSVANYAGNDLKLEDVEDMFKTVAVIGSAVGDIGGEKTATAAIKFQEALDKTLPESIKGFSDELEAVRFISSRRQQAIADEVIESLGGKSQVKPAIVELIRNITSGGAGEAFDKLEGVISLSKPGVDLAAKQLQRSEAIRQVVEVEGTLNFAQELNRRQNAQRGLTRQQVFGDGDRPGLAEVISPELSFVLRGLEIAARVGGLARGGGLGTVVETLKSIDASSKLSLERATANGTISPQTTVTLPEAGD